MQNTFLALIIHLFFTASLFAQTGKEDIKKTFTEYFKTVEQKENSKTLGFIYPKLFDFFPKDELLKAMDEMKNDTTVHISFADAVVIDVSNSITLADIEYALIKYSFKMTMLFAPSEDKDDSALNFVAGIMKDQYGEKNVKYNSKKGSIEILINAEMIAIKDPAQKGWKFLENKPETRTLLEQMLPEEVMGKW